MPKPGVRPIYGKRMPQYKVGLAPRHKKAALKLGKTVSEGIRKALEMAEEKSGG